MRPFSQIDVFTAVPFQGNPVAVVHAATDLEADEMQRIAHWTNLSETTFLLPPQSPDADYRVRIFTPTLELPFAGHPTLGTCHAWLEAGNTPNDPDVVVQECTAGLIRIRQIDGRWAFAAPPMLRSGAVDDATLRRAVDQLGIDHADVVAAEWIDNGPGWLGILLPDPAAVLAVRPRPGDLDVGIAARYPEGSPIAIEVRAFFPKDGATVEDPVTGSLNASLAQWLIATERIHAPYVAAQGTALGRAGRVHISVDGEGTIWVGGDTVTCVTGSMLA